MSKENFIITNSVRRLREERGWSQQELAERAGLSRTGVSAIEAGRLIPSTAAALALAAAFGCRVEDIFALGDSSQGQWAWPPPKQPCRYWRALIGGSSLLYPVEPTPLGTVPHDGIFRDGRCADHPFADPVRTLVLACCDPAVGLLAAEYARQTPFRMLALSRSSRAGLELLAAGLVHAAGLHLAGEAHPEGNLKAAREVVGEPFRLLRVADWQEGLALAPGLAAAGVDHALRADLRWIGREPGSGARQMFDELTEGRLKPAYLARDHRGVVQAIGSGFAQAGISVRLVCEEEAVDFLGIRETAYDLCLPAHLAEDPRLRALIEVVRSPSYRKLLAELPGYGVQATGALR
ncbi:substrate-binding domain-containing protein [Geoalkalibacter sp.]|uniref:substrate-binding domain-containing protein n=1 Tax=Geoalkalibacter sp. TaxID=3041440 RepID=UPI00272E43D8|nr:substrate-binding domain-containing protein [Geoalkalibacter sp.]